MIKNLLTIKINQAASKVFEFTTTPPNSTLWIPSIIKEVTNEWPVKVGTIYTLQDNQNQISEMSVVAIKENESVEWISKDSNYHCRYTFKPIDRNSSILEYYEWVDKNEIDAPFTNDVLKGLKSVLENK